MTNNNHFTILTHEPVKNPDLVRVTFHNREPLEVPISVWVEYGLKDGMEVSLAVITELQAAAEAAGWQARAVRYLGMKPRTKVEIIRYLTRKGATPEAAEQVVERLLKMGYLSDEQYARMFVQSYQARASRREIAWKLNQKGVSTSEVQSALTDEEVYDGELAAALTIARKAMRSLRGKDPELQRQKLWSRLGMKGFSHETARIAVSRVMDKSESITHTEFLDNG